MVEVSDTSGIMFGQQNANYEGQYFRDTDAVTGRCDIANATSTNSTSADGGFPAVVGFNSQDLLDGKDLSAHVMAAYKEGATIEFYWMSANPVTGGDEANCTGEPLTNLLPGGSGNSAWRADLDTIGNGLKSFTYKGEQIPIVFRFLHEMTGTWYWWSSGCSNSTEYAPAWNYTVNYLRDSVGVHNVLYIYAASKVSWYANETFVDWYPGNSAVDIIGFDRYQNVAEYPTSVLSDCQTAVAHGIKLGKVVALAETGISMGIQGIKNTNFFTDDFMGLLAEDELCGQIVYALTWANYSPEKYWVPLKGQTTWSSFAEMYESDISIFAGDKRWVSIQKKIGLGNKPDTGEDVL
mmetsp:Transcript_16012/g.37299  ORF Transcript_16012/g.37299 Transcript_16012/m.37299 type:complete len:351 (+) Transcript_16012:507-1559(+)